jgi:hypothetical protein
VLVDWLEGWSYLEAAPGGERDRTLLLALARLLESDPEPGQVAAMARLAELLLPLMAGETDPLARRRHELLSNNVGGQRSARTGRPAGASLYGQPGQLGPAGLLPLPGCRAVPTQPRARGAVDELPLPATQVARGLVFSLAYTRLPEAATAVYHAAVRWGTYTRQAATSRPLKLLLSSCLTMEEMFIICQAFLTRLDPSAPTLVVFVHMHEAGTADTKAVRAVKPLACVPSKKEEGLGRLERALGELEPPLTLARGGLPSLPDRLVRRFLAARATGAQ